ncbi:UNVERIFIED_CONTAM: hypothetical protein GTU68_024202 [Idotea baltica]|nr:hypothetical protein [Idotea baltica]
MDERVIDVPYWFRSFLVKGIILNTRPKKSAEAYQKIWWEEGSPLIVLSERFTEKIKTKTDIPVSLAMRYGSPSIKTGLQELHDQGVDDVLIVPLYPQFAMATTETILVLAAEIQKEFFPKMKLSDIPAFYHREDYIKVLAESIKAYLADKDWDKIMFSYHGVPERHIRKSDITKKHCNPADRSFKCCQIPNETHQYCYKHRVMKPQEVVPYTEQTIDEFWFLKGVEKLAVVTPAFVADCFRNFRRDWYGKAKKSF